MKFAPLIPIHSCEHIHAHTLKKVLSSSSSEFFFFSKVHFLLIASNDPTQQFRPISVVPIQFQLRTQEIVSSLHIYCTKFHGHDHDLVPQNVNDKGEERRKTHVPFLMSIWGFYCVVCHVTVSYMYFKSFLKPIPIVENICK